MPWIPIRPSPKRSQSHWMRKTLCDGRSVRSPLVVKSPSYALRKHLCGHGCGNLGPRHTRFVGHFADDACSHEKVQDIGVGAKGRPPVVRSAALSTLNLRWLLGTFGT